MAVVLRTLNVHMSSALCEIVWTGLTTHIYANPTKRRSPASLMTTLVDKGFSTPQARKALRETVPLWYCTRAVEWLFWHLDGTGEKEERIEDASLAKVGGSPTRYQL
ncbi:hypothetical protein BJV77DRAFT_963212 [Russula vinacea]|nr:hypothetical protein BJV77DRAFT_963212 [Russula vinacea]